jgi:hypothetical protein
MDKNKNLNGWRGTVWCDDDGFGVAVFPEPYEPFEGVRPPDTDWSGPYDTLALALNVLGQELRKARDSKPITILELSQNGDPYGTGFTASESKDGGQSWFYRGDIGAQTRAFWRRYARRNGHILREA